MTDCWLSVYSVSYDYVVYAIVIHLSFHPSVHLNADSRAHYANSAVQSQEL